MADISKIKLPSGNVYDVKDAYAREQLANGLKFEICWDGTGTPVAADIPAGVVVSYMDGDVKKTVTGSLSANSAAPFTFYLVKSENSEDSKDVYDEYAAIGEYDPEHEKNKSWEKIGDTQFDFSTLGALAFKDSVTLNKGAGDSVLGASTTFTAAASSVSFGQHTTDSVLGADTTFAGAQSAVSFGEHTTDSALGANATFSAQASGVSFAAHTTKNALGTGATFSTTITPATTNVSASASGAAVSGNGTAAAITALGTPSTANFLKTVTPTKTNKLVQTTITPTNGTETVSKVTKTEGKLVQTSIPNVTSAGSASNWSFSMGSAGDAETLIIGGGNGSAAQLGTAITAATGAIAANGTGADVVSGVTISDKTVAKAGSATTVATGALSASGTGDAVVTDVSSTNGAALTALGTPSTSNVLTGVQVTSQPTIALAGGAQAGAGVVSVMTGVQSASTSVASADSVAAITALGAGTAAAQSISVNNADAVTVITALGAATAAGQTVSVTAADNVAAITALGSATAAGQAITVGTNDLVDVAKYGDLSVSVS